MFSLQYFTKAIVNETISLVTVDTTNLYYIGPTSAGVKLQFRSNSGVFTPGYSVLIEDPKGPCV